MYNWIIKALLCPIVLSGAAAGYLFTDFKDLKKDPFGIVLASMQGILVHYLGLLCQLEDEKRFLGQRRTVWLVLISASYVVGFLMVVLIPFMNRH